MLVKFDEFSPPEKSDPDAPISHYLGMLTLDAMNNQRPNCTPSVLGAAISDSSDAIYFQM